MFYQTVKNIGYAKPNTPKHPVRNAVLVTKGKWEQTAHDFPNRKIQSALLPTDRIKKVFISGKHNTIMTYQIEEIEQSCLKIGLSKAITKAVVDSLPQKRSTQENKALHVLFQNISYELNRLGLEFTFKGIKGMEIETTYTPDIVKNFIWEPLQKALLSKSSTTQLTHNDISMIFEILGKWFAENGIVIEFPSVESLMKNKK